MSAGAASSVLLDKSLDDLVAERQAVKAQTKQTERKPKQQKPQQQKSTSGPAKREAGKARQTREEFAPMRITATVGGGAARGPRAEAPKTGSKVIITGFEGLTVEQLNSIFVRDSFKVRGCSIEVGKGGRPHGLVTFGSVDDAERAVREYNGAKFNEKAITVRIYEERGEQRSAGAGATTVAGITISKGGAAGGAGGFGGAAHSGAGSSDAKVKISNIPYDLSEEDLEGVFSSAGKIVETRIARRNGRSEGWATVQYTSPRAAERAIADYNGATINDREVRVTAWLP